MSNGNRAAAKPPGYVNPQETLRGVGGGDISGQDASLRHNENLPSFPQPERPQQRGVANPEFKITAYDREARFESHDKQKQIAELQSVIDQIRQEVKMIRLQSAGLSEEVSRIERAALQALPGRVGVYHVRYYEIILQYLQGLKKKVGEAHTWLAAMQSKKAKRGSAFSKRAKSKGTQYSLSQELQTARSVG